MLYSLHKIMIVILLIAFLRGPNMLFRYLFRNFIRDNWGEETYDNICWIRIIIAVVVLLLVVLVSL